MLGIGQDRVEDLDHLQLAELSRVVVDLDRAGQRASLVPIDPQDGHQFPLDRLAQLRLAVEDLILEPQPARLISRDLPACDNGAMAKILDRAGFVRGRSMRSRWSRRPPGYHRRRSQNKVRQRCGRSRGRSMGRGRSIRSGFSPERVHSSVHDRSTWHDRLTRRVRSSFRDRSSSRDRSTWA